jgi:hypothetical protein
MGTEARREKAQPATRAYDHTCHAACWRTHHAKCARGSSVALGERMTTYSYNESATPNERTYTLSGENLRVEGRRGFGRFSLDVHLRDVAPHIQQITGFHKGLRRVMIYLGAVVAVALIALRLSAPTYVVLGMGCFFLLAGLSAVKRFYQPFEVVQFRTHAGIVVFDIVREKSRAGACDEFIARVRAAVVDSQKDKAPNQAPEPTVTAVTPSAPAAQELRHP